MTRGKAIDTLEKLKSVCITLAWKDENKDAIDIALSALRAQPSHVDMSWWGRCGSCSMLENWNKETDAKVLYCPDCGKPLTKMAFDMLEKRIGGNL